MAVASILRVILFAVITRCRCESSGGYHYNKPAMQFGEILKPPPLPISSLFPVPFHGGVPRPLRQNLAADSGYHYPPPPPPPPPAPNSNDFKFPAPFYKQYNFNFVPPPQPFTTTPSSSLFQKVSGWLFSQQTSYESPVYNTNSIPPVKKDCNPCNLVPWIPVIRYDIGAKKLHQSQIPTYGPPSVTASFQNVAQYHPQPFHSSAQEQKPPQLSPGVPHAVYGPPSQSFSTPGSTYGPPSPTHTVSVPSQSPISSPYSDETSSYTIPSSSYGVPSSSISIPSSSYGTPSTSYGVPSSSYKVPSSSYGVSSSTFATPSPPASSFDSSTTGFVPMFNNELSQYKNIYKELEPANDLQLPKVTNPSGFKNSYGEPITNTYALDIPYPVSATAAESTKVKTEVLPNDSKIFSPNMSLALASPAPFTLNKGRNIHTLQPVALPNLSVSPLPPIFNARPFRPISVFSANILKGINYMPQNSKNVNIEQSVPVAEFTHSDDYPATVIKSTVIDLDAARNQSKAYRNIPNGFNFEEISYQASEDNIAATKSYPDVSFESTGLDFGNELYDSNIPANYKKISNNLSNHKTEFADLRGAKDEDVDKYRTESNLQNIDSPLLYLKPSAPHKDHGNFVFAVSTSANENDYEIYDDISTTAAPQLPTPITSWDESRTNYGQGLVPPPEPQSDKSKPKILQIIVPYTTNNQHSQSISEYDQIAQSWTSTPEEEYQARKVPQNTENYFINSITESYPTQSPTTDDPVNADNENFDSDKLTTHAILNDLYDVKEPPFDIIKLQHTIDDWTAQEYSKHHKMPQKTRTNTKYAKKIPDEFFTTVNPITNYVTVTNNDNYDMYDHEGQSSMLYSVTEDKNKTVTKPRKDYNKIERTKTKHSSGKNDDDDGIKPHIYTAASSFRSTTTTVAPWGQIQTSISPLTKEKIYVVTAKPWREAPQTTDKINNFYDADAFESKRTSAGNVVTASDDLPYKSRFSNRPSFGFSGSGSANVESLKSDSSYAFSKSWHQSINELESRTNNSTPYDGGYQQSSSTNSYTEDDVFNTDKYTTTTRTVELRDADEET